MRALFHGCVKQRSLKGADVGHRAISFQFGNRKSNRTMTLSAMTTIHHHFLSCREDHKFVGHFLAAFLLTFQFDRMISCAYINGIQLTSCQLQRRHRIVQSNYASRKPSGSGLANYPPRRSDYQPASLGRIVGISMPMARGGACAIKRQ
jgi:hypothetical protein